MMHFWKNPIHPLLFTVLALGRSLRHFLDKVTWWHFQSTSKQVIWPQKFLNYLHGLKSAILTLFQKGLGWPCPVSGALKTQHSIWKILFVLGADEYLERLEGKIRKCLFFYDKIFWNNSVNSTLCLNMFLKTLQVWAHTLVMCSSCFSALWDGVSPIRVVLMRLEDEGGRNSSQIFR